MKHLLIILSILLLSTTLQISNITFAQEKQNACLAPMGALKEVLPEDYGLETLKEIQFTAKRWVRISRVVIPEPHSPK